MNASRRLIRLIRLGIGGIVSSVALVSLIVAGCSSSSDSHGGTATATTSSASAATATTGTAAVTNTPGGYEIQVFFSRHPETDNNPAAVFPVHRTSPTLQVATFAIQQLIAGPTASETALRYYTPLPSSLTGSSNCGGPDFQITLDMRSGTPEPGTATLRFCLATQLAGDLTGGIITAEITTTLKQFSTIQKAVILNSNGSCFDDLSGQNNCLH